MSWTAIPAYILDQIWGYQTANKVKDNVIALASRRSVRYLGGSRFMPNEPCISPFGVLRSRHPGLGPHNVINYVDVEIDGTNGTGFTYQARVAVRTEWAFMSVTPKIRNLTDSTDAGTGVACTASASDYTGTNQLQTIVLTIPTGIKKYRLQFTLGANGDASTWVTGELEIFATA